MKYIQKSLGEGEKIVALARFHWWYGFVAWLALIFLGVFIVGIGIFVRRMITQSTTEIGVTTHRFILKKGLFTLHTDEISLLNIEGIQVSQSFWGRLMGFGHLRIEGTGVDAVEIPCIAHPIEFRRAFETAKETGRS